MNGKHATARGFYPTQYLVQLGGTLEYSPLNCLRPILDRAIMFVSNRLPDYSVVVWLRGSERFDDQRSEILSIAGKETYDSTQYHGMLDFHWGFNSLDEAQKLANALKHIAHSPEIVLLHIMSRVDGVESITFKDARASKQ